MIHVWRLLWGAGGLRQKWDVVGHNGLGLASVLDAQSYICFIEENWICAMTRHHIEPNINILLTRNLLFESHVR